MANSPYQIKSEVEDDIESERPRAQSSNTRNFVFPTMTLKDDPIRFVDYTEVADDNCEQYDSQNASGTYNQSLETPALLQRWSEENFKAEPPSDNSFLISGNSASVSQQPLSGLRTSNSQSRSTDCASSTLESQSSTDETAKMERRGHLENEDRLCTIVETTEAYQPPDNVTGNEQLDLIVNDAEPKIENTEPKDNGPINNHQIRPTTEQSRLSFDDLDGQSKTNHSKVINQEPNQMNSKTETLNRSTGYHDVMSMDDEIKKRLTAKFFPQSELNSQSELSLDSTSTIGNCSIINDGQNIEERKRVNDFEDGCGSKRFAMDNEFDESRKTGDDDHDHDHDDDDSGSNPVNERKKKELSNIIASNKYFLSIRDPQFKKKIIENINRILDEKYGKS